MGYTIPLSINGKRAAPVDIGGRESRELPAHALAGLVHQLARLADGNETISAWLEQDAGMAGSVRLVVETARGNLAVLGPLAIDRGIFESAGRRDGFDGASGHVHTPFTQPRLLPKHSGPHDPHDDSQVHTGPHTYPIRPPGPETVDIRVRRPGETNEEIVDTFFVQDGSDATRAALMTCAARAAANVTDPKRATPAYRTAAAAPHDMQIIALDGSVARFTWPALLREPVTAVRASGALP